MRVTSLMYSNLRNNTRIVERWCASLRFSETAGQKCKAHLAAPGRFGDRENRRKAHWLTGLADAAGCLATTGCETVLARSSRYVYFLGLILQGFGLVAQSVEQPRKLSGLVLGSRS